MAWGGPRVGLGWVGCGAGLGCFRFRVRKTRLRGETSKLAGGKNKAEGEKNKAKGEQKQGEGLKRKDFSGLEKQGSRRQFPSRV